MAGANSGDHDLRHRETSHPRCSPRASATCACPSHARRRCLSAAPRSPRRYRRPRRIRRAASPGVRAQCPRRGSCRRRRRAGRSTGRRRRRRTCGSRDCDATRAVVDTHMSVLMPNRTTDATPSLRRRRSRSVPMNAALTDFATTGSPSCGANPSRNALPGCAGCSDEPSITESWRTWISGRPAARHADSSRRPLSSMSGLSRRPHGGKSKPRWTSIGSRTVFGSSLQCVSGHGDTPQVSRRTPP